jgi:protein-disulfide isomerase
MRSRTSALSLSGLALAGAILVAALFVGPVFARKSLAANVIRHSDWRIRSFAALKKSQNNSAAKPSGQTDSKSAGKSSPAPAPAASGSIEKRVEDFLRKWYAWGPEFQLKIGPVKPSAAGDLYEVSVEVTAQGGSDTAIVYVTKDGHYMLRGDLQDLNGDPLGDTVRKLNLQGAASKGPADAKVVLVEFGDLECPSCRQLDYVLRAVLPKYPQVRLVFKDFPLETIHPWAMSAAIAGRCALQQSSDAFWKYHDSVYDNQDLISPENAYDKLLGFAVQAGAAEDKLKACIADPKTQELVRQSMAEGHALDVTSTPTTFVDGRRMVGPDQTLLEQYIQFDSTHSTP